MFYPYNQNNSGGHYVGPAAVIVESPTIEASWDTMRRWIDEHSTHHYCTCCGERWRKPWDDGYDTLAEAAEWIYDGVVVIVTADGESKVRRTLDVIAGQEDES